MTFMFTTYGLLLVLAIFSFAQLGKYKQTAVIDKTYQEIIQIQRVTQNDLNKKRLQEVFNKEKREDKESANPDKGKKKQKALAKKEPADTRTQFLHIGNLFVPDKNILVAPQDRSTYVVLRNLIEILYKEADFLVAAKTERENVVEEFLQHVIEATQNYKKDPNHLFPREAENLGKIELKDELFQYLRYKMLQGSKIRPKKPTEVTTDGYYSLASFIKINSETPRYITSVFLAPPVLLLALFENQATVNAVIQRRTEILRELRRRKKPSETASDENEPGVRQQILSNAFEREFKPLLRRDVDSQYIDFKISTSAPTKY